MEKEILRFYSRYDDQQSKQWDRNHKQVEYTYARGQFIFSLSSLLCLSLFHVLSVSFFFLSLSCSPFLRYDDESSLFVKIPRRTLAVRCVLCLVGSKINQQTTKTSSLWPVWKSNCFFSCYRTFCLSSTNGILMKCRSLSSVNSDRLISSIQSTIGFKREKKWKMLKLKLKILTKMKHFSRQRLSKTLRCDIRPRCL